MLRRALRIHCAILAAFLGSMGVDSVLAGQIRIKLATTTSTENSGLLYELLPPFEREFNVKVDILAVGTGQALKLGENGDVDIVLVHARAAEDDFVRNGFGVNRRDVMYNDFVIVGPREDPAGVKDARGAGEAFRKIAEKKASFASRGDDSGTHQKEKSLWRDAGIEPAGSQNLEATD